ncbi:pyrroloquinoline quinone-dependent dehydrogenase [Mesobacterium pallidum]|uniref:pyrroloquinoline quinone-dependent dehydrogenase n=1 Tax=Mesobacterium pallidum TaxID=2872037 RepID=UPI001EE1B1A8|nr:PQQ-binding-like beta-propeller repeat protein [Mesobacterium pallidum]
MKMRGWIAGSTAIAAVSLATMGAAQGVTTERLLAAGSEEEAANWLMVHKTYDGARYSSLNQINASNVANMRLAFAVPLGGLEPSGFGLGYMEGTPLVDNGFMYVSDPWGTPYKIDVSSGNSGRVLWVCDTGIDKDPTRGILLAHRGMSLYGNTVISALNDGRVVACDTETGDVVWDQQITENEGEGFTGAPLIVNDKILIGQSYGDWATRGFLAALDAKTGEEDWRFYTVPAPGEPGSETWLCEETGNPDCWKTGGAAIWQTGAYDPDSNTTFWGTGNPVPMFDPEYRPGTNLYTNSTLAMDPDSGELKWHFQYTPGDYLDYDEVGSHLLMTVDIDGEQRKVMSHFGRNGFFYSLDQANGSYIHATQYINELNWTEGLDPKTGQPVEYDPSAALQTYALGELRRGSGTVTQCPHLTGGVNYYPTAYNPVTGVAYGAGVEGCSDLETVELDPEDVTPGVVFLGGTYVVNGKQAGSIAAIDVKSGQQVAKHQATYPNNSGVTATPDLIYTGWTDGKFAAYDATSLEELWSINVGTAFRAPPMTYAVDGKQYVAIMGGYLGAGNAAGNTELETIQGANMVWVFTVD